MSRTPHKLIVSNVDATVDWLRGHELFRDFRQIDYLGNLVKDLQPGDIVVGSLPLHLAAKICAKGAEYWYTNFRRPRFQNRNLTASELAESATVERYHIETRERII